LVVLFCFGGKTRVKKGNNGQKGPFFSSKTTELVGQKNQTPQKEKQGIGKNGVSVKETGTQLL
jgi:hypothetical protein